MIECCATCFQREEVQKQTFSLPLSGITATFPLCTDSKAYMSYYALGLYICCAMTAADQSLLNPSSSMLSSSLLHIENGFLWKVVVYICVRVLRSVLSNLHSELIIMYFLKQHMFACACKLWDIIAASLFLSFSQ